MIRLSHLRKSFGAIHAVDGVSLAVARGQTLGLLGPNGAGKSTTMNLICGLLRADAGEILIDGTGGPERMAVRARLGLAPQSLAIYEKLSGLENLLFFGELYGLGGPKLRERARWALAFTGLEKRGADRAGTYSGGMQRRLNLACALVHEPALLLLDEPTAGVDPQSRNHLLENILELKKQGLTILYTTHYMEEAEKLCDRIAIMDGGRVLAEGTLKDLRVRHGGGTLEDVFLALTGRSLRD